MTQCSSCGGANPPEALRCEYCDQALAAVKALEVAWSARTGDGATGEGRIRVNAPATTEAARVRTILEAAFAASVDAVGSSAGTDELRSAMQERLGSLLPKDHQLIELEVSSFKAFVLVAGKVAPARAAPPVAAARTPVKSGGGKSALAILGCSLLTCMFGGLCLVGGALKASEAKHVKEAKVMSAEEAEGAAGMVCVEGTVATVDSALVVPGLEAGCLYYEETIVRTVETTRTTTRGSDGTNRQQKSRRTERVGPVPKVVQRFHLGPLVVVPDLESDLLKTQFLGLEKLPGRSEGETQWEYSGLRVGIPLTVVGEVQAGEMRVGGPVFVVSSLKDKAAVVDSLESSATFGFVVGVLALLAGGGGLAAFAFTSRRRG